MPGTAAHSIDEWSIGIYAGVSPFALAAPADFSNPVLTRHSVTDATALFVADPFALKAHGQWYVFFEVMNQEHGKGEIGLAISSDCISWNYQGIVLAEPYHLSYPYVFEWMDAYYMIPESFMAGAVRLYKAIEFPSHWSFVGTLLCGPYYADSSVFRYDGKWWLFTDASPDAQHDTLRLFWAEEFTNSWQEHPRSPIVSGDPHVARPAGRINLFHETPIRYAQDCYPAYGTCVRAFEITELTTETYQERQIGADPIIQASGSGWNRSGMHHIDPHLTDGGQWIACVDGLFRKEDHEH